MDKCRDWERSGWAQKGWGMYQVEKCTPTRWYSLGEHPRVCLLILHFQNKTSVFSRTPSLLKYFHTLLHKLEQEGATLVTAHESSIALEEALEG